MMQTENIFEEDGLMSNLGCLMIHQTEDWTNHSKVVIRTSNQDLINSLLLKTTEMSNSGFCKIIYTFGYNDCELHIFSRLGSGIPILSHLLYGQDDNRLSSKVKKIETIN